MTTLSRQACRELAALARLSLDDAEADRFAAQLGTIIGYVEQLQAVDTTGVLEHLPPPRADGGLRADVAGPALARELALAAAPAVRQHQVLVPKFKDD